MTQDESQNFYNHKNTHSGIYRLINFYFVVKIKSETNNEGDLSNQKMNRMEMKRLFYFVITMIMMTKFA